MRLESEFYNSVSVTFINKEKAEYAILFSQYGTSKELNENKDGYPILRLNEFSTSFISEPSKYCCLLDNDTYQTLRLKKDDVLICRTNGNPKLVGKSAIVPKDYDYAFASYLFRVRPKKEIINSATLVAFLNCKYGRMEIEKYSMVGNQANFSPAKFREISIPILGLNINNKIENMTYLSFDKFEQSKSFYSEAEKCLLECLGMKDFVANPNTINAQSLKDSFLKTGRLDAEFYQPKYDELINLVKSHQSGYDKLGTLFLIKDRNYIPVDGCLYKYIELSNIGFDGSITGHTEALGEDLPSRARRIVRSGDLIVSSLEGSLNSCAIIPEKYDGAICSTGFYVLTPKDINVETALVLFKSQLMQALMTRVCSGSIMAGMNTDEFANLIVPKIDQHTQHVIAEIIQDCAQKREESIRLLELAKTAVEIAIEHGEDKAMELLTQNM